MIRNELLAITTSAILLAGCSGGASEHNGDVTEPDKTVAATEQVNFEKTFQEGLELYTKTFGCPTKVTIKIGEIAAGSLNIEEKFQTTNIVAIAVAEIGSITINAAYPEVYRGLDKASRPNLKRTAIHEAAHACVDKTKIKPENYTLFEKYKITKTEGLSPVSNVLNKETGDYITLSDAEEAAAEVLASSIEPGFTHPSYDVMMKFMKAQMDSRGMTERQLAIYLQNSDFDGFFKQFSGLEKPTPKQIEELFTYLQQLAQTATAGS